MLSSQTTQSAFSLAIFLEPESMPLWCGCRMIHVTGAILLHLQND